MQTPLPSNPNYSKVSNQILNLNLIFFGDVVNLLSVKCALL